MIEILRQFIGVPRDPIIVAKMVIISAIHAGHIGGMRAHLDFCECRNPVRWKPHGFRRSGELIRCHHLFNRDKDFSRSKGTLDRVPVDTVKLNVPGFIGPLGVNKGDIRFQCRNA